MVAAMTNNTMTLHQQAQQALSTLNCSHPDAGVMEFQRVLAQLAPGSHDAQAIKRAIDRLEEIADAIAGVKGLLAGANFSSSLLIQRSPNSKRRSIASASKPSAMIARS